MDPARRVGGSGRCTAPAADGWWDYKTGTKKAEPEGGLLRPDCQMPLYLFSLTGGRFTGAEPAGCSVPAGRPGPRPCPAAGRARNGIRAGRPCEGRAEDLCSPWTQPKPASTCPLATATVYPSPSQKDKRADIAKLNRIQLHLDDLVTQMGEQLYGGQDRCRAAGGAGKEKPPASGATTALSAATRPASVSGRWRPRPSPLSRKKPDDGKEGEEQA